MPSNSKLLSIAFLLALLGASFAAPPARRFAAESSSDSTSASNNDSKDDSNEDDDDLNSYKREVEVEVGDYEAVFKSQSKLKLNGVEVENKIEFKVKNEERFEIEAKQEGETESSTSETETEAKYKLRFARLVEFRESNGKAGFQEDDEIINDYDLNKIWEKLEASESTVDGTTVNKVVSRSASGPAINFELLLAGDTFNVNGVSVEPSNMKFSFGVDGYTAQADTMLALQARFRSEVETEGKDTNAESALSVGSFGGLFSWEKKVEIDGAEAEVITEIISCGEEAEKEDNEQTLKQCQELTFTFNKENPSNLFWDPKVGFDLNALKTNGAGLAQPTFLFALLAILGVFFAL